MNLFENLHSFKVAEASDLISWLDFLLDNLFLCFGQGDYRQCIGIPMGTNCVVYLANFYLFTYEFDFVKHLLKSNTCPVVLHSLSLVCRYVDDLFVPDFADFENFMYQDSFGSGIYPKTSCELNCTSKGFSCNFFALTVRQSPQGLSCDIFDKCSQPEYAGIEMIRMPHVHSNISMTAKLGVINSKFYRFLRLRSCKKFFVFQMVSLIVFLKAKGYPLKVLLKRTRGLVLKEKFLFRISTFGIFRLILLLGHVSGELPVSPLVLSLSLFFSLSVFLCFFVWSLLWGLLLASSMAESSRCFWNCSRNSVCRMVLVTGLYPL